MDLKIKYLTLDLNIINEDVERCNNDNERIVLLLEIKSFLTGVLIKLENEAIMPISYYNKNYEMLKEGNEEVMFFIRALYESIIETAGEGKKYELKDDDYYVDGLLREKIPQVISRINTTIKYIDTQIELFRQRMSLKPNAVVPKEDEIKRDEQDKNKLKKWKKNKGEFALYVVETYKMNMSKYRSLRDASNKLFEEHEFDDKKWTKEECYDYVRKK